MRMRLQLIGHDHQYSKIITDSVNLDRSLSLAPCPDSHNEHPSQGYHPALGRTQQLLRPLEYSSLPIRRLSKQFDLDLAPAIHSKGGPRGSRHSQLDPCVRARVRHAPRVRRVDREIEQSTPQASVHRQRPEP